MSGVPVPGAPVTVPATASCITIVESEGIEMKYDVRVEFAKATVKLPNRADPVQ